MSAVDSLGLGEMPSEESLQIGLPPFPPASQTQHLSES